MRMRHAAVVAGLALGLMSGAAKAAILIDIDQDALGVTVTGSGSFDTSTLSLTAANKSVISLIRANTTFVSSAGAVDQYSGLTGPSSIGPSMTTYGFATSSGDAFGLVDATRLDLPVGYVSGTQLAFSVFFGNRTFNNLGLTPGTYIYSATSGATRDTISVNIGAVSAVPLPASAPMFGAALMALGAVGYGLKRKGKAAA